MGTSFNLTRPPGLLHWRVSTQAGGWADGEQPCQAAGAGGGEAGHDSEMSTPSPEGQPCPGLHQKVDRGDSGLLVYSFETST